MELPEDIQEQLDELMYQNEAHYESGDLDQCIQLHQRAWALFPEPKHHYINEGYSLIQGLITLNLKENNTDQAEKWLAELEKFDQKENLGTTEFARGQVLYARKDFDQAKIQFKTAHQKSGGRLFEDEDPAYLKLLRS